MRSVWASPLHWGRRRVIAAVGGTLASALVLGLPSDLVANPVFGRQIAAPGWAWPALVVTSVLSGLLLATYVRDAGPNSGVAQSDAGDLDAPGRRGLLGGVLGFLAVGCPVCNKLVLLALGYSGAVRWFEPVQPLLALLGLGLLAWALRARLRGELACALPTKPAATRPATPPAETAARQ